MTVSSRISARRSGLKWMLSAMAMIPMAGAIAEHLTESYLLLQIVWGGLRSIPFFWVGMAIIAAIGIYLCRCERPQSTF